MSKKVNFVFDWIGPARPISNNFPPGIFDLASASGRVDICKKDKELDGEFQESGCYTFLKKQNLTRLHSVSDLPKETFLYEYNYYWWNTPDDFFNHWKLNGILGWGQVPLDVFDRIRNRTAYLLISTPLESPIRDYELVQIENYFRKSDLPLSQVIYLTCSPNGQEIYDNYCKRANKPNEGLIVEYLPFYVYTYKDILHNNIIPNNTIHKEIQYTIGKKSKTFLMFNRRWASQAHRVLMLAYLNKYELLDQFYISFSKLEIDTGETYSNKARQLFNRLSTENIITEEDLNQIETHLPLVLDTGDHTLNLMFDEFDSTMQFYENSFVHIISETNFFTPIIHLTEKSYKPVVYKQPFIMFAAKGSLQALQDQGFKTFSDLWDESYDTEDDDTKRFFRVLDLIKEIASWSDERKIEASEKIKNIVDFNYSILKNETSPFVLKFIEKYGTFG